MPKDAEQTEQAEVVDLQPPRTVTCAAVPLPLWDMMCKFFLRGAAPPGTSTDVLLSMANDMRQVRTIEVPVETTDGA